MNLLDKCKKLMASFSDSFQEFLDVFLEDMLCAWIVIMLILFSFQELTKFLVKH